MTQWEATRKGTLEITPEKFYTLWVWKCQRNPAMHMRKCECESNQVKMFHCKWSRPRYQPRVCSGISALWVFSKKVSYPTLSFTYSHMHNNLQKQADAPWITADASIICHWIKFHHPCFSKAISRVTILGDDLCMSWQTVRSTRFQCNQSCSSCLAIKLISLLSKNEFLNVYCSVFSWMYYFCP